MLGILGGMGPAATVDLMAKIFALTPAERDEDHIPLIVCSDPRVPSIAEAIFHGGPSPVPKLIEGIRKLEDGGAKCIAIACHAAFHWYDELTETTSLPIIHIADAICDVLAVRVPSGTRIGLIAAAPTLRSGFYDRKLAQAEYPCVVLPDADNEQLVFPAIKLVKQKKAAEAAGMFRLAARKLTDAGASVVIGACTEIPLALDVEPNPGDTVFIDGNDALARACVAWWLSVCRLEG